MSGPVDVTDSKIVSALDVVGSLADNGSEVGFSELLLGHGGELVDSHIVGSVFVVVVGGNLGEVLEEDSLSVGVFELGGEGDTVLGFPGLEFRGLGGALVVQEHCGGADDGKDHSKLLSVHFMIMNFLVAVPLISHR